MRTIALALIAALGLSVAAPAQECAAKKHHVNGDLALTYQWMRSNAQPGDCGCFNLNGGGISASVVLQPRWSVVLDGSAQTVAHVPDSKNSLTLAAVYLGPRYSIPQPWKRTPRATQPYVQALLGGMHAGGAVAGAADGTMKFSTRVGGGLDQPLSKHTALRLVQVDYNLTTFENTVNERQNNLLVSTGFVFRW